MEKKIYVEPSVKKVEFEFNECIAASPGSDDGGGGHGDGGDGGGGFGG